MTLETNKTLGGIGALLMFIGPISGAVVSAFSGLLSLIGIILVLIAAKGLADHYNDGSIFNNTLYGIILTIVGAVAFAATIFVGAVNLLTDLGLDLETLTSDYTAISSMNWQEILNFDTILESIAIVAVGVVILFVFCVISAIFYRKSLTSLAEKTGVSLFGTTGLIILIGAVLTIIGIGALLLWIALLLLAISFFSIKDEPPQPPPTP